MFTPQNFQLDFEMAAMEAVSIVFPGSAVHGCMFHFGQCLIRWISRHKMLLQFHRVPDFRKTVMRLAAMAFMPLADLDAAWLLIHEHAPPEATPFMDYFHSTWFDETSAKFPRHVWNHHQNYGPRTTNHIGKKINKKQKNRKKNKTRHIIYISIYFQRDFITN